MLADSRSKRPADLPEFSSPPVTEVVLGVQFHTVERFLSPYLGLVWDCFKAEFPNVEEHAPILPTFETFGPNPQFIPGIAFQMSTGGDMPRVFFINSDRTELLQVQRDRFLHNWRKVGAGDKYPRFEHMLATFVDGFEKFDRVIRNAELGSVVPNQCEVSYINQVEVEEGATLFDLIEQIFPQQVANATIENLGRPDDLRFLLRYIVRDATGAPMGRLLVSAEPARRADGRTILQLTLTARGTPSSSDTAGVIEFLQQGRLHVVRTFTRLTSEHMHKAWGRVQ